NPRVQNDGIQNQLGNGNLVAVRVEGNAAGHNRNQIRCCNCRGVGHFARDCTVRPKRRDAAYLQTQLLIAQKEEAGIQLQAEEYDLMAAAADLDEIEEVNANCILMANLQQASSAGTQTDSTPIYDLDGSAEVLWIQNQLLDYGKELASPKQTALGKTSQIRLWLVVCPKLYGVNIPRCDEDSIELKKLMVFMATATIKKVNDVVQLHTLIDGKKVVVFEYVIRIDLHLDDADGVECLLNEEIFAELARMGAKRTAWNESSCSMASAIICLAIDDLTSHNTRYTSPALTQKVFANIRRVGKGFSEVKTPLFASMLVQPQPQADEEEEEVEVPNALAPPSPTNAPSPPPQDPTPTPHAIPLASPLQEQPTITFESSMSLLTTLMETWGEIEAIDADEDITLVDVEKDEEVVTIDAKPRGRINQEDVNAASKGVSTAEPIVFDDEEVTITMAQTLIKLKYDDKEENIDWNVVAEQVQERHRDNIRKYQSLKKKPVSMAQARKNMIIYLKNMDGYKIEHFKGKTYDKGRPIFKREYKKVQTLFNPDKDVEEPKKKRVADETLLQESFKKLKAVEVSGSESTQEIPSNDLKEMYEEDVQNMHDMFMLTEKDYPLSNAVMTLMLSAKLQVEEDNEMARDLVMKIFIEDNRQKSKSLDTSSK
nr:hypothetical protein [Tanacetum cinerariifolium]